MFCLLFVFFSGGWGTSSTGRAVQCPLPVKFNHLRGQVPETALLEQYLHFQTIMCFDEASGLKTTFPCRVARAPTPTTRQPLAAWSALATAAAAAAAPSADSLTLVQKIGVQWPRLWAAVAQRAAPQAAALEQAEQRADQKKSSAAAWPSSAESDDMDALAAAADAGSVQASTAATIQAILSVLRQQQAKAGAAQAEGVWDDDDDGLL